MNPVPYFPTVVLATELPSHFAVEILGGRRQLRELKLKKNHMSDTNSYLGQFSRNADVPAMISVEGSNNSFTNLCLMPIVDEERLNKRFPGVVATFQSRLQFVGAPDALPVRIGADSNFTHFERCLIVNTFENAIRIRHIWSAILINKTTSEKDYIEYLQNEFRLTEGGQAIGWKVVDAGNAEYVFQAAQFSNAYLLNNLSETTIGTYLENHGEILKTALDATEIVSEPYLPWQISSPYPDETAINPDLFIRREDGFWDVYDLKLPLLGKKSITTGKRQRRRLIATIENGIAQLAHYRDFLSHPENLRFAFDKYGVEFDNPTYGIIAGNDENFDSIAVKEALRRFPEFTLLDYDSVVQLYLAKSRQQ